jgi:TetR/AcrR family transcriptional repressor of mexJK operon
MQHGTSHSPSRREARRESRRDAILDFARQTFLENGYAATTMSGIAAGLGGSKGTLWSYFSSKQLLFEAVLDRATEDLRNELSLILQRTDDVRSALHRFCRQFLGNLVQPDAVALFRLVVAESGRFPELGESFFERGPGRTRLLVAQYLADAMARGLMRKGDAHAAALDLTGLCMSGCHFKMLVSSTTSPVRNDLDADAERAIACFWRAWGPVTA